MVWKTAHKSAIVQWYRILLTCAVKLIKQLRKGLQVTLCAYSREQKVLRICFPIVFLATLLERKQAIKAVKIFTMRCTY